MSTDVINQVKAFLQMSEAAVRTCLHTPLGDPQPVSLAGFLLANGREWKSEKEIPVKRGRMKQCYKNATNLCYRDRSLTYCEGYAVCLFPVLHGWCIDAEGNVVEPTWRKNGAAYFGIAFNWPFVVEHLMAKEYYGILDQWGNDFPIIKTPRETFCHQSYL